MTSITNVLQIGSARNRILGLWRHPLWGGALKVLLGYLILVEGVVQLVFGRVALLGVGLKADAIPRGVFVTGAVLGSLSALVAMGLILVYRANRIISFTQAQLGSVPAIVALLLIAKHGLPYVVALPIVIAGGALLGGITEVGLVRRFSAAPRLILTVVTIGVSFVLLVLEFYSKQWVGGHLQDQLSLQFPTPFRRFRWGLGPATLTGDHIFAVVVVGIIVVALGAFFRFTDMGIAVRASAENGERAQLLGIPTRRVSTVVWMIAAVLSAVGVFLRGPLIGVPLTGFVGLHILLYGLAGAVIAKMESLPTAFFAGMFLGIVEQSAVFVSNKATVADAIILPVVLVALLAQRGSLSRAMEMGSSSWQAVKDFRPIPTELRGLPEVRRMLAVVGVIAFAFVAGAPFLLGDIKTPQATLMVIYAIVGVSLVVLTGWAGQISLGQYAIAGVGAAVAGGLAANHNWDFFGAVFVAGLAGAFVAVLIGLPALRIQGLFLAVTTLAFAFAVQSMLTKDYFPWLLPKDNVLVNRPVLWKRFNLSLDSKIGPVTFRADAKFYYLCLVFLLLALAMARSLRRNRSGRVLIGVRDNGRVMQAYGVNLARSRLAAFAISGFLAGMAGGLLAFQNRVIADNSFSPEKSIALFVMAVIGGIGSLPGAMLGAVYVVGIPLIPGLRDLKQIELLTSGLGLLLLLNFLPGGLAEGMYRVRDRFLRRVAADRNLFVPSLVADSLEAQEAQRAASDHIIEDAEHSVLADPDTAARMLTCPQCGARVPADEAHLHDHFAPTAERAVLGGAPA